MKKSYIILSALSIIIFNCTSVSENDLVDPDPVSTSVTYNNTVGAIIANNCLQCHTSPPQNGAPISFTTFDQTKNNIDKILNRINSPTSPMPPSGQMPQQLRDQIQQWKDDGLLEN